MTGETTLALHPASAQSPAGAVRLGFNVLAAFEDSEGGVCSVSGA